MQRNLLFEIARWNVSEQEWVKETRGEGKSPCGRTESLLTVHHPYAVAHRNLHIVETKRELGENKHKTSEWLSITKHTTLSHAHLLTPRLTAVAAPPDSSWSC